MYEQVSERVKILIGPATMDEKLEAIRTLVEERLLASIGGGEWIPGELKYIVDEVSIARFNMIGSEGTHQHDIEGELMRWDDNDLFAPYEADIARYLARTSGTGKVRFL